MLKRSIKLNKKRVVKFSNKSKSKTKINFLTGLHLQPKNILVVPLPFLHQVYKQMIQFHNQFANQFLNLFLKVKSR